MIERKFKQLLQDHITATDSPDLKRKITNYQRFLSLCKGAKQELQRAITRGLEVSKDAPLNVCTGCILFDIPVVPFSLGSCQLCDTLHHQVQGLALDEALGDSPGNASMIRLLLRESIVGCLLA